MRQASEKLIQMREAIKDRADKIRLAIVTPTYEMKIFSPYKISSDATLRLLWELGIECDAIDLSGDSYVQRAKNTLLTKIHQSGRYSHVLFIDSDMSWNPEAVLTMLLCDKELVGGAYPTKNNWGQWGVSIYTENSIPVGDPSIPLIRAEFVSGGFLMLKMSAIDRMVNAYPELTYWAAGAAGSSEEEYYNFFECQSALYPDGKKRFQGEDITFMKRFTSAGGEVWVYPNITFGHYGIKGWEGNYHEFLMRQPGGANSIDAENPLVSVVIVGYHNYEFISECIDSVLRQTYKNIEIIVVDNSEDARMQKVIESFPVRIIKTDNEGVSRARNLGIASSCGKWVCCLDGDDKIHPDYISKCIANSGGYDIMGSWMTEFGESSRTLTSEEYPKHKDFLLGNMINCASLFKKDIWAKIGGYDEHFGGVNYLGYEDWDFWIRATGADFKVKVLQEVLFYWRRHDGQITSRMSHQEMCSRVFAKHGVKEAVAA